MPKPPVIWQDARMKARYLVVLILASACNQGNDDDDSYGTLLSDTYLTENNTTASDGSDGMVADIPDDTSGSVTDECSSEDNCESCVGWFYDCTTGLNFPSCIAAEVCCGPETTDRHALQVCACVNCAEQCPRICASDGGSGYASVGCSDCLDSACAAEQQACGE